METTAVVIGSVIKRERTKQKVTQEYLSDLSGVPKARISRYEHGHTLPTIETLTALGEGLGVPASTLLRRAGL